ncbi:unnamed protein product, partial [Eretmochelys imbricata]
LRPREVRAARDLNEPGWLRLETNDLITVIEGSPESSTWRGQNRRTLQVGIFPASVVSPEESPPLWGAPGSASPSATASSTWGTETWSPAAAGGPDRIEELKGKPRDPKDPGGVKPGAQQLIRLTRLSKSLDSVSDLSVLQDETQASG